MRRSLPLGLKWPGPGLSGDKRVFHGHTCAPPRVLVEPQDPLEKIDEGLDRIDLTLKDYKTLDPPLLLVRLCQLLFLLLIQEDSLHVIQRVEFYVLLRDIQADPSRDLKLLECFEPEIASLRVVQEEFVSLLRLYDHMLWDGPEYLCDALEHVILRVAREYGYPEKEFSAYAPHRPHVDGGIIGEPQNDLRAPVVSRLDVVEDGVPLEAGAAEVDDFEVQIVYGFEEDVLWLEVTVNQLRLLDDLHGLEDLVNDEAAEVQGDSLEGVLL